MQYLSFWAWLISLSTTSSGLTCVDTFPFLRLKTIPRMHAPDFLHPFVRAWIFSLILYLGYGQQCYDERGGLRALEDANFSSCGELPGKHCQGQGHGARPPCFLVGALQSQGLCASLILCWFLC